MILVYQNFLSIVILTHGLHIKIFTNQKFGIPIMFNSCLPYNIIYRLVPNALRHSSLYPLQRVHCAGQLANIIIDQFNNCFFFSYRTNMDAGNKLGRPQNPRENANIFEIISFRYINIQYT